MPEISPQERVDVMLTPEFYTLKRESLPVKYAYQAKKIAPSLFDGMLDEGEVYAYFVSRGKEGWEFIAYAPQKIRDFLLSKGITPEKTGKIFFAQQAVETLKNPVALGEEKALVSLDEVATVVPRAALAEGETLATAASLVRPKKGISLGGSEESLLTLKQSLSLAAVLLLFAGMWFYEGLGYGGDTQKEQSRIEELLAAYPALGSSYARQSVAEKYQKLDQTERRKREVIKALSKMIFKGVTLTSLEMNDKGFKAEFATTGKEVADKLKLLAKKEKFNTTAIKGSNGVRIEGQL
jgi:hypothetical protein